MVISAETQKKKKPPSFKHYPAAKGTKLHDYVVYLLTYIIFSAKSLKKAWVEKAKIKRKWKTERQKMGLPSKSLSVEEDVNGIEENEMIPDTESEDNDENKSDNEAQSLPIPKSSAKSPAKASQKSSRLMHASTSRSNSQHRDVPDLRELTRKAYSRETLHTYKSQPSNQRGGNGGRGRGRGGTRGRGQPDMRLRMGVMLEKIKRDFT
ncbi:hypothetical protein C8R42DRAFT_718295 [Lentinula raphanica]|nr:hypothetical protein C8R42DRAFT_718295 [Lentinula raphanica]